MRLLVYLSNGSMISPATLHFTVLSVWWQKTHLPRGSIHDIPIQTRLSSATCPAISHSGNAYVNIDTDCRIDSSHYFHSVNKKRYHRIVPNPARPESSVPCPFPLPMRKNTTVSGYALPVSAILFRSANRRDLPYSLTGTGRPHESGLARK